jgi:protein-S-isoprenylcysteine O-methyltransferase Ste14
MYVSQALIAFGAPLAVCARWCVILSALLGALLVARARLEERALRRAFPEYDGYARDARSLGLFS